MVDALIVLAVLVIVVGIVVYLCGKLIELIPMDERFRQIAWVLVILIAVLVVISRALPLLGISSPV